MRGKRSKQYRRLIEQYARGFGFREPYQVIVDAEMVQDTTRCKMDLIPRLTQVLHGTIKPIITQCCMRHLYAHSREPGMAEVIEIAKGLERRRCGHHPDDYPEPLSAQECVMSIVGDKNKHRYMVATQDVELRRTLRGVPGVPLVYVNRSVMIMEPMASATAQILDKSERSKFRQELRGGQKRKREAEEEKEDEEQSPKDDAENDDDGQDDDQSSDEEEDADGVAKSGAKKTKFTAKTSKPTEPPAKKKKKRYGAPKGPNPLSMKKKKKPVAAGVA